MLEKTTRINLLFDFYGPLLTEKQKTFLTCYFHDDLSLGEIAAEFEISRQAVYEHIKRAEATLAEYENKLQLLAKFEERTRCLQGMREEALITAQDSSASNGSNIERSLKRIIQWIDNLERIDD
ncbi:putative DNA-binding protein [Gorillibacterium massiliense]|uniref:putative DNA-binding protein n=1 Tax=Gorillibacterium massiliense TaxID=1280390 RepID=UPI001EE1A58D|nr:putative DNA-binding protein [Gorillibacterium massiliense]